jgi:hypothetical protein
VENNDNKKQSEKKVARNIDISKLKDQQKKQEEFYKNADIYKSKIEQQSSKRALDKQALIDKINTSNARNNIDNIENTNYNLKKVEIKPKERQAKAPSIQVIQASNNARQRHVEDIKHEQERLRYTLQIDTISAQQINSYKQKREINRNLVLDSKFATLNQTINQVYYITIIILITLICLVLIIF